MILFIFEGKRTEPNLFKTIEKLYFQNRDERKVYCFGYNIYELYKLMNESDFTENLITVIRSKMATRNDHSIPDDVDTSDFSEIFLFFDYDFQNKNLPLPELNKQLEVMLDFFSDETENGKLYINYPMVESIRCTNELPDSEFINYKATRSECSDFKKYSTSAYPFYKSTDFFLLPLDGKTKELRKPIKPEKNKLVKKNWELLKEQHVKKANYICNDINDYPNNKISVSQEKILKSQLEKHIHPHNEVSILNAFPLFLFEYFRHSN